jgi:glycerophosphoryl diester phosphodiesterase
MPNWRGSMPAAGTAPSYAGEPLPTFADAAELCQALGLRANVEIKPSSGADAETGRKVAGLARELWQGAVPPLLSSFSVEALAAAAAAAPELPRGWLVDAPPADWPKRLHRLEAVQSALQPAAFRPAPARGGAPGRRRRCWSTP